MGWQLPGAGEVGSREMLKGLKFFVSQDRYALETSHDMWHGTEVQCDEQW